MTPLSYISDIPFTETKTLVDFLFAYLDHYDNLQGLIEQITNKFSDNKELMLLYEKDDKSDFYRLLIFLLEQTKIISASDQKFDLSITCNNIQKELYELIKNNKRAVSYDTLWNIILFIFLINFCLSDFFEQRNQQNYDRVVTFRGFIF